MQKIESARRLRDLGCWVFPVVPGQKTPPAVKNWQAWATRDVAKIEAHWSQNPDDNIGVFTGKFADDKALLVVDVDRKNGKDGGDELVRLELKGFELPDTLEQKTATGSRHLLFVVDEPVKQGSDVLAPGLDIRSSGGYILGAGSTIGSAAYTLDERPIARAEQWLIDRCGKPRERKPSAPASAAPVAVNAERAIARATEYLTKHAPTDGDPDAYNVACEVRDFGVDEATALQLMQDLWDPRCDPPRTDNTIDPVRNAYRYAQEPLGVKSPEADFEPIPASEIAGAGTKEPSYLDKINRDFALIFGDGGHSIMQETVDEKGGPRRNFLPEISFRRKLSTKTVTAGKKTMTYAEAWLDWPGRREYAGLCFAPEREPRHGYFNLWRGFTVAPVAYADAGEKAREGFDLFMDHLRANVCNGEPELAAWLIGYFAHMIQRPWERPLTTLVFRGGKGVGKNALIERVGRLLGPHFLVAHDTRYLTGNFNSHMDSCLCLVLDEAFWSGDKAADGKLKGLTTAPQILIERKGKEAYMVDNLVRLVIMGNAEHLVPASEDERRYAVFDVGDGRKQDLDYFDRMRRYMDDEGGASVLLDHLKRFDLASVNVNRAPDTAALLDQKTSNLAPFGQFWLDCLSEGAILHLGMGEAGWPERVERGALRSAFHRYSQERRITARGDSAVAIGKALTRYLSPHGAGKGAWTREGRCYELPVLDEARKAWDRYIGRPGAWVAG